MKTKKTKIIALACAMAAVLIFIVYLIELFAMAKAGDRSIAPITAIGIFILAGAVTVIVPAIVFLMNRFIGWFEKAEIGLFGTVTYAVFTVCMFLVFPFIKVPYALIPKAEMGAGYVTFLIQLFTIIPALICALISLVYMLGRKN